MNWTIIKAVIKAKRNGLLRLVPAAGPTRLDCLTDKCAKCCKTLGSPVVTNTEAQNIDTRFIQKNSRVMFIKSQNSACCLLKDGLCSIYNERPAGCREYPWYNIDRKLHYDSGCPGIKHDIDQRPDIEDIQPFENFFPLTPKPVLTLLKKICVKNT